MKRILYIFYFFLLTGNLTAYAQAPVSAELLAQKETISSNKEFFLALKLTMPRGWHVYWKNPGDAGEAVELKLDLPEGFEEIERFWAVPERFGISTLTEYGYRDEVLLPIKLRAPEKLTQGEVHNISGRAVWMACQNECVPMSKNVSSLVIVEEDDQSDENEEVVLALKNLPQKTDDAVFFETSDSFILSVPEQKNAESAYFFPEHSKTLIHSAPQIMKKAEGKIFLFMKKSPLIKEVSSDRLNGTLVLYNVQKEKIHAWDVEAPKSSGNLPVFDKPFVACEFLSALFFAFMGGLLLNLMPCVFPVLSLKAFKLLNTRQNEELKKRRFAALSYTAGVLLSFFVIGIVLLGFRAAGTELGWGFQLQYPPFVLGLCLFLFFLGLVFSDVVAVGEKVSAFGMNLGRNWGDFGTGVLAVFVATPCAAPFMGTALGYGLISSAPVALSVLLAMGAGLAFPFLLLDFYPSLGRFLPKAGVWMQTFRQFLAFPLYASAAWLLWVLAAQEGNSALAAGLSGILVVSFCAWFCRIELRTDRLKNFRRIFVFLSFLSIVYGCYAVSPVYQNEKKQTQINWLNYDPEKIQEYRQAGVPVFIKFSAKWCLTCLVNEKTTFSSEKLKEAFEKRGVAAFLADWTNRSDEISAALESFGRGGIPLYIYYAPYAEKPLILPQLLTEQSVLAILPEQ